MTGLAANTGLIFFVLCCAVENYAEFPQAIFLPILLYVVAVSRARVDVASQPAVQTSAPRLGFLFPSEPAVPGDQG